MLGILEIGNEFHMGTSLWSGRLDSLSKRGAARGEQSRGFWPWSKGEGERLNTVVRAVWI